MSDTTISNERLPTYSFPGGYSILYLTKGGDVLCSDCANDDDEPTELTSFVRWEGADIECAECNATLASDYGDPEAYGDED